MLKKYSKLLKHQLISLSRHAPLIISLSLAFLYMLGLFFYQGYFFAFGIDERQFMMPMDRIFSWGFISLFIMLGPFFYIALVFVFVFVFGFVFGFVYKVIKVSWTKVREGRAWYKFLEKKNRIIRRITDNKIAAWVIQSRLGSWDHKQAVEKILGLLQTNPFDDIFIRHIAATASWIILFLIFGMLVIYSGDLGKQQGQKFIQEGASDEKKRPKQEITLKNGETIFGYTIICTARQCAFFVDNTSLIYNVAEISSISTSIETKSPGKDNTK